MTSAIWCTGLGERHARRTKPIRPRERRWNIRLINASSSRLETTDSAHLNARHEANRRSDRQRSRFPQNGGRHSFAVCRRQPSPEGWVQGLLVGDDVEAVVDGDETRRAECCAEN